MILDRIAKVNMGISELYDIYLQYPTITTDTRLCPANSIFFALKGDNFNGNEFAEKALSLGCKFAVVDEAKYVTNPQILLVKDCLIALQQLANFHRQKLKTPIIAITGTNGKTTTKELMTAVLSKEYNVVSTAGNFNNHIGVPLTLLSIQKEHEIAIVEMGANHVEEIKALAEIAEPNYGLITNIGHAHLEGFGSYENIIKAKGELYDYIRDHEDGKLFVDYDNQLLRNLSEGVTCIYYGLEEDLFVSGKVTSTSPYLAFDWYFGSSTNHVKTQLIGVYNLSNALAAIAVGKYFGIKTDLICQALEEYTPSNNRSQLKETSRNMLVVDAYNANPTSMQAALENFRMMDVSRKVLILGDMKELGEDTAEEHQKVVDFISKGRFDEVYLIGNYFFNTKCKYPKFKNFEDFKQQVEQKPIVDSYVLIKGSRGGRLERCIELL